MEKSKNASDTTAARRCVGALVRHFIWLLTCIAGVAAHHSWFGIGKRGFVGALADGVIMAAIGIVMVWINGKLFRPNTGRHLRPETKEGE